jgi:hypothetical protein
MLDANGNAVAAICGACGQNDLHAVLAMVFSFIAIALSALSLRR